MVRTQTLRSAVARARRTGIVVSLASPPSPPLRLRAPCLWLPSPSQSAALSATCGVTRSGQNGVGSWSRGFSATFIPREVRAGRRAAMSLK